MSFGQNVQVLRRLHNGMTQENLAEILNVSRQTVSKWETDDAYPEMEKAIELSAVFSCSLDQLIRGSIIQCSKAYSDVRIEEKEPFRYVRYAVVSHDPEGDAIAHIRQWAEKHGVERPEIIGWDFPCLSQEQINVYHMHGYTAACVLPDAWDGDADTLLNGKQKYAVITVKDPFSAPFELIPSAYRVIDAYMNTNKLRHEQAKEIIPCFEKSYEKDGAEYMDIYIAVA